MKDHILIAMKEQINRWGNLPEGLSEAQITVPRFDSNWAIKDVITHLWVWQQISIARVEAGTLNCQPHFPEWVTALGEGLEEDAHQTNAWMSDLLMKCPCQMSISISVQDICG